jgi:rubrerythrin
MRYICQICGYVYDDIKEKLPFDQLPEGWKCPLCGATKQDFAPERPKEPTTGKDAAAGAEAERKPLSAGQLAALCSNLARGCEKQYKPEEAKLFRELADYFAAHTPPVSDATVEGLASLLRSDAESYAGVRAAADAAPDRGAARVCVWGEKVTRMLSSLVDRYLREGEAMLAGTDVWICTVCGFVWVGGEAPPLCPVCKVPDWKFEKIEGRA